MAELVDAAKKLVKFDGSGKMTRSGISLRLSGQGSGITEKFRYLLEGAGASVIVKTASGKYHNNFDNDAGRSALQFVVDAVQKHKIDDPKVQHDADAFAAGATAMLFREAWVIGEIQEKTPTLEYGVAPIPKWTASSPNKMLLQPWGIYVNGKSSNKAAAWEFVKFLTNPENSLRLTEHDRLGFASARTSTGSRCSPRRRNSRSSSRRPRTWTTTSSPSWRRGTRSSPRWPTSSPRPLSIPR